MRLEERGQRHLAAAAHTVRKGRACVIIKVMMTAASVLELLGILHSAAVPAWLDGGWGVDALLGYQHRDHTDVDVVVVLDRVIDVLTAVPRFGLVEDHLPTRAVLRNGGHQIDLHPVRFDAEGVGRQVAASPDGRDCIYPSDGFVTGTLAGTVVPCLSAEVQLAHHLGYHPRAHDYDDMRLLSEKFSLRLPPPYGGTGRH